MAKTYTVSDGKLVLQLKPDDGGWYTVTSPLEPGLVTMAKNIPQAFEMAYDALRGLREVRRELRSGKRRAQPA